MRNVTENDTEENHTGPIMAQNVNLAWFKTDIKCQINHVLLGI